MGVRRLTGGWRVRTVEVVGSSAAPLTLVALRLGSSLELVVEPLLKNNVRACPYIMNPFIFVVSSWMLS